jgi:hypothetical protein
MCLNTGDLPGADLFDAGVEDLRAGVESTAALLVSRARGRLVDACSSSQPIFPSS